MDTKVAILKQVLDLLTEDNTVETSPSHLQLLTEKIDDLIVKQNEILDRLNEPIFGEGPNGDLDPNERLDYLAVEANISTEIARGETGKINIVNNTYLEGKIESVVITGFEQLLVLPISFSGFEKPDLISNPEISTTINTRSYPENDDSGEIAFEYGGKFVKMVLPDSYPSNKTTLYKIVFTAKFTPGERWGKDATGAPLTEARDAGSKTILFLVTSKNQGS